MGRNFLILEHIFQWIVLKSLNSEVETVCELRLFLDCLHLFIMIAKIAPGEVLGTAMLCSGQDVLHHKGRSSADGTWLCVDVQFGLSYSSSMEGLAQCQ